jgi:hypothetical protein
MGCYLSQDPIRLAGNNPTLYGYVKDPNSWLDIFGLAPGFQTHHVIPRSVWKNSPFLQNSGLGVNDASNKIDLPTTAGGNPLYPNSSTHDGWNSTHSNYNQTMTNQVRALETQAQAEGWSQSRIQSEIQKLQNETKTDLNEGRIKCH